MVLRRILTCRGLLPRANRSTAQNGEQPIRLPNGFLSRGRAANSLWGERLNSCVFLSDIGISIARMEPRIVPIGNKREKINFSLPSSSKKQQENGLREKVLNRQQSSVQLKKEDSSPKATTKATMNESGLEKLRKEYDSSDSEASEGSSKREKSTKKMIEDDKNVKGVFMNIMLKQMIFMCKERAHYVVGESLYRKEAR